MHFAARTPRKSADTATSAFAENLEAKDSEQVEPIEETNEEESADNEQDEGASEAVQGTYTYEQLKSKTTIPGVDYKRREVAYMT